MKFIASIDTVIYGKKYLQGQAIDLTGWTRKQELQFLANGLISPSQITSADVAAAIAVAGPGVTTVVNQITDQTTITVEQPPKPLDWLTDVDTVAVLPTNGQTLVFDSVSGLWKPGTIAGGGGGGGAAGFPLDAVPVTPHAKDDEFNGVALDAKWVSGAKASTKIFTGGWLNIAASANGGYATLIRQIAPTGDFTIKAKVASPYGVQIGDDRPGIFMARAVDSRVLVYGLGLSGGPAKAMWIEHSNYSEAADWAGYNGAWSGNMGSTYSGGSIWYRMRWVAATGTITVGWSVDGVVWIDVSSRGGWAQPDRIGIVLENNSGNTSVAQSLSVDWFRVTEP